MPMPSSVYPSFTFVWSQAHQLQYPPCVPGHSRDSSDDWLMKSIDTRWDEVPPRDPASMNQLIVVVDRQDLHPQAPDVGALRPADDDAISEISVLILNDGPISTQQTQGTKRYRWPLAALKNAATLCLQSLRKTTKVSVKDVHL